MFFNFVKSVFRSIGGFMRAIGAEIANQLFNVVDHMMPLVMPRRQQPLAEPVAEPLAEPVADASAVIPLHETPSFGPPFLNTREKKSKRRSAGIPSRYPLPQ